MHKVFDIDIFKYFIVLEISSFANREASEKNISCLLVWVFFANKHPKKNTYGHIGIYQFRTSILKKFVNLRQSKNEIKHRLEQLRAIENGINIDVVYSKNKSFGIDTVEDYVEIKKIMEYKIKKL